MTIRKNYSVNDRSLPAVGGNWSVPLIALNQTSVALGSGNEAKFIEADTPGYHFLNTGSAQKMMFAVPQLVSARIASVVIAVQGAGSHVGLPATMPKARLIGYNLGGVAGTDTGDVVDTSASVAAYEAVHLITLTPATPAKMSTEFFILRWYNEASTNALAGLQALYAYAVLVPE